MANIRFAKGSTPFYATLKERVAEHLQAEGLPRHGGARILAKTALIVAALVASYVGLVFYATVWWQVLILAFICSQAMTMVGFDVMHDAGHGAFSDRRWVNRFFARGLDAIGGNQTLWRHKHGVLHHTYTNLAEMDDDLDTQGMLRLHPDQAWKPHHRFQPYYALPLYSGLALMWFILDFPEFFQGRVGRHETKKHGKAEAAIFLGFKLWFVIVALVIPLSLHAWYVVLPTLLFIELILGFCLALVFQLAHVSENVEFPTPADGTIEDEWAVHQLKTTTDFAPQSPFWSWYMGGLNHQVVHHLFIKVSHVRYREIQPVVEATCRDHGLPYHSHPSVWAALRSHLRQLRTLSKDPRKVEAERTLASAA